MSPFADGNRFAIIFTEPKSWEEDLLILFNFLPDSIIPWVVGGLVLLALFALTVTLKAWRESKRSPYFFMRMQAGKKMQRYFAISVALVLLTAAASAYAWQAPEETAELVGVLKHAKPNSGDLDSSQDQEPAAEKPPETITINLTPVSDQEVAFSALEIIEAQEEPESAPVERAVEEVAAERPTITDSQLGNISFSLDISGGYQPINPGYQFVEGFYTLYATFSYQGMADGINWAWSWQRNGAQVEGGNQVWSYGQEGPGYIYFRPEEGFRSGEYTLAIWVNDVPQNQSSFIVGEGVAASN
jgi:hypothetical protein